MKTTALIGSSSSTSEDGPKRSASVDINRARTPRMAGDDEAFFPDRKGGASPSAVPRSKSSPAVSRRGEGGKQQEEQNWNADLQTTKANADQPPMKRTQSAPHKKQNNNHK